MLSLHEVRDKWYSGSPVPGLAYRHDDVVLVLTPNGAWTEGWVVSVERVDPEPAYLVELCSGAGDRIVAESALRRLERTDGPSRLP